MPWKSSWCARTAPSQSALGASSSRVRSTSSRAAPSAAAASSAFVSAASAAGGPAGTALHALWNKSVKGAKPYTGFEGTSFDAANVAFLAALRSCSAKPAKIKSNLVGVSGPPGAKVTFLQMKQAIKLLLAHKDVNYEGAFSPVDFDANGDIGSAVYEIWQYKGSGQIATLRTITFKGT